MAGSIIGAVGSVVGGLLGAGAAGSAADAQVSAANAAAQTQRDIFSQIRRDFAPQQITGNNALFMLADLLGVDRPASAQAAFDQSDRSSLFGDQQQRPGIDFSGDLFIGPDGTAQIRTPGQERELTEGGAILREARPDTFRDLTEAERQTLGLVSAPPQTSPTTPTGDRQQAAFDAFRTSPGYQFRLDEGLKAVERSAAARGGLLSGATMKAVQRFGEGLASDEFGAFTNRLAALAGIGQTATQGTAQAGLVAGNNISSAQLQGGAARASGFVGGANAISGGIQSGFNNFLLAQALRPPTTQSFAQQSFASQPSFFPGSIF